MHSRHMRHGMRHGHERAMSRDSSREYRDDYRRDLRRREYRGGSNSGYGSRNDPRSEAYEHRRESYSRPYSEEYDRDYDDYDDDFYDEALKKICDRLSKEDPFRLSKDEVLGKAEKMGVRFKDYDEEEFYVTYLMMVTDFNGVSSEPHAYVAMAKQFLEDNDVALRGSDKLCAYICYIVLGEE